MAECHCEGSHRPQRVRGAGFSGLWEKLAMKTFLNRKARRSATVRNIAQNVAQALEQRLLFSGFTGFNAGDLAVELLGPGEGAGGALNLAGTPVSVVDFTTTGTSQTPTSSNTVVLPTVTGSGTTPNP